MGFGRVLVALTFHGGASALVMTPPCGATAGLGLFVPWSGNPYKVAFGPVTITQTFDRGALPVMGAGTAPA